MASSLPPLSSLSSTSFNPASNQIVLSNWLKAVTAFHLSYLRLQSQRLDQAQVKSCLSQCSSNQVLSLLERMEHELAALLVDCTTHSCLTNLVTHTGRLNALTTQAKVLFMLSLQSSC